MCRWQVAQTVNHVMLDHMSSSGVMHGDGRRCGEEIVKHEVKEKNIAAVHTRYRNTHVPDVAVPDVHPAAVPCTLDVRRDAVKQPVALFVTEATLPPGGAVLVLVVSVVGAALTAVVPRELHLPFAGPHVLGGNSHCHLVERGALQCIVRSGVMRSRCAYR